MLNQHILVAGNTYDLDCYYFYNSQPGDSFQYIQALPNGNITLFDSNNQVSRLGWNWSILQSDGPNDGRHVLLRVTIPIDAPLCVNNNNDTYGRFNLHFPGQSSGALGNAFSAVNSPPNLDLANGGFAVTAPACSPVNTFAAAFIDPTHVDVSWNNTLGYSNIYVANGPTVQATDPLTSYTLVASHVTTGHYTFSQYDPNAAGEIFRVLNYCQTTDPNAPLPADGSYFRLKDFFKLTPISGLRHYRLRR